MSEAPTPAEDATAQSSETLVLQRLALQVEDSQGKLHQLAEMMQALQQQVNAQAVGHQQPVTTVPAVSATSSSLHGQRQDEVGGSAAAFMMKETYKRLRPEPFKGERDAVAVENFIAGVKAYLRAGNLSPPQAVSAAASFLEGPARTFWRTLAGDEELPLHVRTPEAFFTVLRQRYLPTDSHEVALQKLEKLKMAPGKSAEYTNVFQSLTATLEMPDHLLKHSYKKGLTAQLKKVVVGYQTPTLADLIELVERVDAGLAPEVPNSSRMDVEAVGYGTQGNQTRQPFRNVVCWKCGKRGHVQRNCRSAAKGNSGFRGQQQEGERRWAPRRQQQGQAAAATVLVGSSNDPATA